MHILNDTILCQIPTDTWLALSMCCFVFVISKTFSWAMLLLVFHCLGFLVQRFLVIYMLDLFVYLHLSLFLKLFPLPEFFFFLLTIYLQVLLVLLLSLFSCMFKFNLQLWNFSVSLIILSWLLLFLSSNLFWNVRLSGYIFNFLCRHVFLALDFL